MHACVSVICVCLFETWREKLEVAVILYNIFDDDGCWLRSECEADERNEYVKSVIYLLSFVRLTWSVSTILDPKAYVSILFMVTKLYLSPATPVSIIFVSWFWGRSVGPSPLAQRYKGWHLLAALRALGCPRNK